jgi:hypothetical protein
VSLNDLFGPYPGRPDHPDFAKLSDIVLQQDGRSYDEDFNYGEYLAQFIDPASIRHMARERSRRIADGLPKELTLEDMVAAFGAVYLDAFMVGYMFHAKKAEEGK